MATIRKSELAAQLEAARVEISRLKAQLAAERAQHQEQIDKHSHRNQLLVDENALLRNTAELVAKENDALRAQHKEQLLNVTEVASAVNKIQRARPQYEMPEWQRQRAEAMAAAKALAMEMGRTVSVPKAVNA